MIAETSNGISETTSISTVIQWELVSHGGHWPVHYTVKSCVLGENLIKCMDYPVNDSTRPSREPISATLIELHSNTTYNIIIAANTTRRTSEGEQILWSETVFYNVTTRGTIVINEGIISS